MLWLVIRMSLDIVLKNTFIKTLPIALTLLYSISINLYMGSPKVRSIALRAGISNTSSYLVTQLVERLKYADR